MPNTSKLNPYINFRDQAKEALEFYQSVFGGKVTSTAFKDGGMPHEPADADKIMHGALETESGMTLMMSDLPSTAPSSSGSNIQLSLSGDNEAELTGFWDKLTEGGKVTLAFNKAPWGDSFGMLTDKFGIDWMVNITAKKA
jgi:PhnB protein